MDAREVPAPSTKLRRILLRALTKKRRLHVHGTKTLKAPSHTLIKLEARSHLLGDPASLLFRVSDENRNF